MLSTAELYEIYLQHPNVVTDTRKLSPGCIFFALKGENFDGNAFAEAALSGGAAYSVVDNPVYNTNQRYILVEDVLTSLQDLARHHRRQFDIPILAITGSNGKTTTKELTSAVLSSHYPTHFTKGNLNNHIGVPLTLLSMPPETEVAVIEMGANHPGDIDFLCKIAEPTHGLITNVGKAHLEGFGSFNGVKQTKSELYRYLQSSDGLVFINKDEKYLMGLAKGNFKKIPYYSVKKLPEEYDFVVKLTEETPLIKVSFETDGAKIVDINTQLMGKYNFNNIMTAVVIGKYFKVPEKKIKHAIESYTPSNNRSQIVKSGTNTYILDAYNANPSSMRSALENFKKIQSPLKIAILGDMLELGEVSRTEHESIVNYAKKCKIKQLVLVGQEFGKISLETFGQDILHFETAAQAKEWLGKQSISDATILLKGSRGIKLETLLTQNA